MNAVRYAQYPDNSSVERGAEFQDWTMVKLAEIGIYFQVFTSKRFQFEIGESMLHGSPDAGVECKLDGRIVDRLSIETAERVNERSQFVASGILRQDNTFYYVQGNFSQIYVFEKSRLLDFYNRQRPRVFEWQNVRKFYLYLDTARREAAHVWQQAGGWIK